ncbi:cupredoxin domain-containing protein, partial [Lactobacillus sp. XV13L]|nr:cupredoxin domain-containing protein [Lactobacillus sp. XV13L]
PETVVLKKGIPAQVHFQRQDPSSCLEKVVFPDLGINEFLPEQQDHPITIDTSKAGEYDYACGMNMFHGKVIVK